MQMLTSQLEALQAVTSAPPLPPSDAAPGPAPSLVAEQVLAPQVLVLRDLKEEEPPAEGLRRPEAHTGFCRHCAHDWRETRHRAADLDEIGQGTWEVIRKPTGTNVGEWQIHHGGLFQKESANRCLTELAWTTRSGWMICTGSTRRPWRRFSTIP